jgi:hypothetical protein
VADLVAFSDGLGHKFVRRGGVGALVWIAHRFNGVMV